MLRQDVASVIARGMRIQIRDSHGVATDITDVFFGRPERRLPSAYDILGRPVRPESLQPGTVYINEYGQKVVR